MFEIDLFNKEVIEAFLEKKSEKKLNGIERASRAKLRDLFLMWLATGELEKDRSTLMKIFNPLQKYDTLEIAIKKGEDKFRPLQDFMIEKTTKPTDNVIKLLSILIDFEPRPFNEWQKQNHTQNETTLNDIAESMSFNTTIINKEIAKDTEEGRLKESDIEENKSIEEVTKVSPLKESNNTHQRAKKNESSFVSPSPFFNQNDSGKIQYRQLFYPLAGSTALLVVIFSVIYFLKPNQCMCWNGEHYVEIDCQDKELPFQIIGLDKHKLADFRKITRPDTLSDLDIGKVWYSKINSEVEFFTTVGFGFHPEHMDRSLKCATANILEKYAGKNAQNTNIE